MVLSPGDALWLIGGTSESAQLVKSLAQSLKSPTSMVVTVTTATACQLYPQVPWLKVWVGRLCPDTVDSFLNQHGVHRILDMSHPFAVDISRLAIATAHIHHLPYLRYERPGAEYSGTEYSGTELSEKECDRTTWINHYSDLIDQNLIQSKRVLLTLGYRALPTFQPWQSLAQLYARILPSRLALHTALDAGFDPPRLIALRPPITPGLEAALWQQWRIDVVVTKASGHAGGELTKRQLAQKLGVQLILLRRPKINYPCSTDDIDQALSFCL